MKDLNLSGYDGWFRLFYSGILFNTFSSTKGLNEEAEVVGTMIGKGKLVKSILLQYLVYTSHSGKDRLKRLLNLCPNLNVLRLKGSGGVNLGDLVELKCEFDVVFKLVDFDSRKKKIFSFSKIGSLFSFHSL